MIHKLIEATFAHSPKHRTQLYAAVCNIPKFDFVAAGYAIGVLCRRLGLVDYPNPFRRPDPDHSGEHDKPYADWETGFSAGYQGKDKPESSAVPVKKSKAAKAEAEDEATAKVTPAPAPKAKKVQKTPKAKKGTPEKANDEKPKTADPEPKPETGKDDKAAA